MRNPCRLNVIGGFSPGASKEEEEVKKSQTEECPALVEPIVSSRIPWVLLYSEETLDFGLCGAGPGYTNGVVRSLLVYFLPNAEREKTDVNPSPLTSFDKNAIRSSSSSNPMASNGVASMRFFFVSPLTARRSPKMHMHYT